jgi:hypothetical protein
MINSIFWNKSDKCERPGDPLGFDALREAMSDCVVPHLTGGTNHADDHLWVLVGLRWAHGEKGNKVDADVWEQFRKFERALKQYWEKFTKRHDYTGKDEVVEWCKDDRPTVFQPIFKNERAGGLLGSYIASLRVIGLVDKSALALTKVGDQPFPRRRVHGQCANLHELVCIKRGNPGQRSRKYANAERPSVVTCFGTTTCVVPLAPYWHMRRQIML